MRTGIDKDSAEAPSAKLAQGKPGAPFAKCAQDELRFAVMRERGGCREDTVVNRKPDWTAKVEIRGRASPKDCAAPDSWVDPSLMKLMSEVRVLSYWSTLPTSGHA